MIKSYQILVDFNDRKIELVRGQDLMKDSTELAQCSVRGEHAVSVTFATEYTVPLP